MKKVILLLLAMTVVLVALPSALVTAAEPIAVTANSYKTDFPKGISFHVEAQSQAQINKVTLLYEIKGHGSAAYGRAEFTPGASIQADFKLDTSGSLYIPPTTELSYRWQIEDVAGNSIQTDPVALAYDDGRFNWQKLTEDNVTIYWYQGDRDFAQRLLSMVLDGVDRLSWLQQDKQLEGIRIVVYPSKVVMDTALPKRSRAYTEQIITLGTVVSPQIMILLGQQSGLEETVYHELSHMVLQQMFRSPYGSIPSWLDEGLAVNNQSGLGDGYEAAFRAAVARDKLISLRSLTSQSGDPSEVTLWYGEAGAVVKYMLETAGKPKMVEYLRTITSGTHYETAMKGLYGYDLNGLEAAFRESLGLPARQASAPAKPTSTPNSRSAAEPTQPTPVAPAPQAESDSFPVALVAGLFVFLVVAALALSGVVLLLVRRR